MAPLLLEFCCSQFYFVDRARAWHSQTYFLHLFFPLDLFKHLGNYWSPFIILILFQHSWVHSNFFHFHICNSLPQQWENLFLNFLNIFTYVPICLYAITNHLYVCNFSLQMLSALLHWRPFHLNQALTPWVVNATTSVTMKTPSSNFLCSDNPSQPAPCMKALLLSSLELQAVLTDHCSFPKNCLAFSTEIF